MKKDPFNKLTRINAKIDDNDSKAILLNSMPPSYENIFFTLKKVDATLEEIISTLNDEGAKKLGRKL